MLFVLLVMQFVLADPAACTVDITDFPATDRPSVEDRSLLSGCESKKFYYGIDEKIDHVKARKCAFLELERNSQLVFGDYAILMMIYANGFGTTRDVDLAQKIALCHVGGSEAEITGRRSHLESLKTKKSPGTFDLCDDITSGVMMGFCSSIKEEKKSAQRSQELKAISSSWSPKHQKAFTALGQKAYAFFKMRSLEEIDKSGSARSQQVIEDESLQRDQFKKAIVDFESGRYPSFDKNDLKKLDDELNAYYKVILNRKSSRTAGVYVNSVRKVQREWVDYKNMWVAFAALHYPRLPADNLRAWLTKLRLEQLKEVNETLKLFGSSRADQDEDHQ